MTSYGTSYFTSEYAATRYYQRQTGESYIDARQHVQVLLDEEQIHIGPPSIGPNERLEIIDNCRYAIVEVLHD